ncbi:CRISPR-associated protein, Crm2 family [Thermodesulfatator indicus DSM 15286]|uniref:CRISPR-associated protein, Crm2 family n=1 Tax=Thermodesulfatator indicus (strain DSM 15286 / JCM 11887 / CIR29812) TaxID=667014 RepID=F8A9I7_THEID|nr:type III-B CRISPR-associated protein Cas10/Cmr2 [Thermodesulfatator indicus]AEH45213.1 CRISPR-associated protein, Crm2 family [Thermodesulfatator indicus DSM 15286]
MTACKIRKDENYWREKLAAFLHDPPDKALSIWGHVKRAEKLREKIYVSADENLLSRADQVASGLDRTFLPERESGGEIKFPEYPVITHPTGKTSPFNLGPFSNFNLQNILSQIEILIAQDSNNFPKHYYSFALFHYFRHVLPWRLAQTNVGNLAWHWWGLPADTRLPDHSIWQHCALTSALYSCYRESPDTQASLMVFSLTPVQDFIARSRKLRDYWTASLILSWLASEGLWVVISRYGSDHIIYPAPIGQALIEAKLDKTCGFSHWTARYHLEARAATLPNKFLFLSPAGQEKEIAELIEKHIEESWKELAKKVKDLVKKECFSGVSEACLKSFDYIFDRQATNFWEFHWTAVSLLDEHLLNQNRPFLPKNIVQKLETYLEEARQINFPYLSFTEKFFYPASYDFAGRGLAAEKLSPREIRPEEPGIKCHLHTDFEALRFSCLECKNDGKSCELNSGRGPDSNPRPSRDPCWQKIRKEFSKSEFKETERLSALGLIKRLASRAVDKNHPLYSFFQRAESFPSTTEIALKDWLERAEKDIAELGLSHKDIAEILHQKETNNKYEIKDISKQEQEIHKKVLKLLKRRKEKNDEPTTYDRYYAILVMDGDRMGRLLSGGFAARWRDVLHPEIIRRLENGEIGSNFKTFWLDFLNCKRLISPAVHAAISKALSDFALYTVPSIVARYRGRLIYAGGDDVCAVFPISSALKAAREIAHAYNWAFVRYGQRRTVVKRDGKIVDNEFLTGEVSKAEDLLSQDLLLLHLGPGEEISISGGLLFIHHKWPLRAALERAHSLLEIAKDPGRRALALELQRRAGEQRTFVAGFKEKISFNENEVSVWDAFEALNKAFASRKLSSSFAYRPKELAEGLEVLSDNPDEMARFILAQIKTGKKENSSLYEEISSWVATVLLGDRRGTLAFEALEIARFLGEAWRRHGFN